jgi:hypothetical protein
MAAWRLTKERKLPMLMMVHDDTVFSYHLPTWLQAWTNDRFANAYRDSASRICISPAMEESYAARFGARAEVIYPIRDPRNPVFSPVQEARPERSAKIVFAYAGSIHGDANFRQLIEFASVAGENGHKLIVYSPQFERLRELAGGLNGELIVRPPVSPANVMERIRAEADCLLVTGSFDPAQREEVSTLFPSKMADYSAIGLPVLAWAPDYASITRFVKDNPDSAELVTEYSAQAIKPALECLAASFERRRRLASTVVKLGDRYFSPEAAWKIFSQQVRDLSRKANE